MKTSPVIEQRSFDYVPLDERRGSVLRQTQFWFIQNASFITAFTGAIGPSLGLGLLWSIVAIALGSFIGTCFQAFHGSQGPHMGLPQMIQSRVQFGSRGALIPIFAAALVMIGFGVYFLQIASGAVADVASLPSTHLLQVVLIVIAVLGAVVGIRVILAMGAVNSYIMTAALILLTVAACVILPVGKIVASNPFSLVPFLAQFGASAIFQLAIAPYVSDFTRYLPPQIANKAVITSVFGGTLVSAIWVEALGALVATARPKEDMIASLMSIGNSFGFGLGSIALLVAALVCLVGLSQVLYSAAIIILTAVEAFVPIRSSARLRTAVIILGAVIALLFSLTASPDLIGSFFSFLSILGYLLVPWTAVNLSDYYLVRRGCYSITGILDPKATLYGKWSAPGLVSYGFGFAAMIPFFSNPLYTGPIAKALGGADVSFIIGLVVSTAVYLILMRSKDLTAEFAEVHRSELSTEAIPSRREAVPTC